MANLKQSAKRARQDIKRRLLNKSKMSMLRTYIKKFLKLVGLNNFKLAYSEFGSLVSKIDKCASKGIIKKNKANRLKHRLNLKLKVIKI